MTSMTCVCVVLRTCCICLEHGSVLHDGHVYCRRCARAVGYAPVTLQDEVSLEELAEREERAVKQLESEEDPDA